MPRQIGPRRASQPVSETARQRDSEAIMQSGPRARQQESRATTIPHQYLPEGSPVFSPASRRPCEQFPSTDPWPASLALKPSQAGPRPTVFGFTMTRATSSRWSRSSNQCMTTSGQSATQHTLTPMQACSALAVPGQDVGNDVPAIASVAQPQTNNYTLPPNPGAHGPEIPRVQGPGSTVHGPRSTVHGPRSTVHGPGSTIHDPRPTAPRSQRSQRSQRSRVHGPRPNGPTAQGQWPKKHHRLGGRPLHIVLLDPLPHNG